MNPAFTGGFRDRDGFPGGVLQTGAEALLHLGVSSLKLGRAATTLPGSFFHCHDGQAGTSRLAVVQKVLA